MGWRLRLAAAARASAPRFPSRGRPLFAALALLAAAVLVVVAWRVQSNGGNGAEPIGADRDAPLVSVASDPEPASAGSSGSTERNSDASGGSGPDASPGDPGGGGAAGGENGGTPSRNEAAAGDGGAGPDGSIGGTSPNGDEGAPSTSEEGQESGGQEAGSQESGGQEAGGQESGDSTGAVVDIPEPEAPADGPRAPLTGELTSDFTLAQRRALVVKVGNSDRRSRPQAGLAAADIVYETLIEGGESRLMAVFHSEMPGRVGPVRSARTSDFDLLADLSRPYLASSGANTTVLSEMRRAERAGTIVDIGGMRTFVPYSRDSARRSPHNLYFHSEYLTDTDGAALRGGPLETPVVPLLDYGSSNPAGIAGANGVTVTYHRPSGNVVSHIWDAAVGGWVRIQEGDLMLTETDFGLREVAPVNVAVMWMTHRYALSDAESPLTQSYGTGDALVLTAGSVHEAVWERTEDRAGFRFVDTAGRPLSFSPGSTWLLIANSSGRFPVTGAEVLAAADGTRVLTEAREAHEAAIIP